MQPNLNRGLFFVQNEYYNSIRILPKNIVTNLSITNTDYAITTQDFTDLLCIKPATSGNDVVFDTPTGVPHAIERERE